MDTARYLQEKRQRETDAKMAQYLQEKRQRDRDNRFRNSWRLLCDGVVINTASGTGGEFSKSLLDLFRRNIIEALNDPEWVFVGAGGEQTAADWLKYHEDMLGVKLTANLEIMEPNGIDAPLCPTLEAECHMTMTQKSRNL